MVVADVQGTVGTFAHWGQKIPLLDAGELSKLPPTLYGQQQSQIPPAIIEGVLCEWGHIGWCELNWNPNAMHPLLLVPQPSERSPLMLMGISSKSMHKHVRPRHTA